MTTNELQHHGILGMKWGIRRYQNEDGSYTKAGRKRYGLDLDVNDTSRSNIAKIRTGEAKRRLDVAKENNPTNKTRIAELQGRVRSAKRNERVMKAVDKGAARVAKGETISGNKMKTYVAHGAAFLASAALVGFLNSRMGDLSSQGRWTQGHQYVAEQIAKYGQKAFYTTATVYALKKAIDNNSIRAYNNARLTGKSTITNAGSVEYRDRKKAASK